MYAYIYDSFTNDRRYGKLLYKTEKRLTDLNLNGKIIRLGVSKNIKVAVEDEIRQGTRTIVAVGNDSTVSQVINYIVSNQSDEKHQVTLGIIPIAEKENKIAAAFGINSIADACEILLARRLESFRLAQINQGYFLFKAEISAPDTILEIDKNYLIQNSKPTMVEITNSPIIAGEDDLNRKLKLRAANKDGESMFSFKELLVVNNNASVVVDGSLQVKNPARIRASAEQIRIIVGKQRNVH
jgi:diacylglycerol kinase family enzyme